MNIPEEAIQAGVDALDGTGVLDGTGLLEDVVKAILGAAAPLIAAQVPPGHVIVDADDLTTVLNQRTGHAHSRPGIWDDDNRPGLAGTRCVECAARDRLRAAMPENGRERSLDPLRCPTCSSPQPSMHPAIGGGGEVTRVCGDPYHREHAYGIQWDDPAGSP